MSGTPGSQPTTPLPFLGIDAQERRVLEGNTLFRLAQAANAASAFEPLCEPSLDAMCQLLALDRAAILLLDADGVMRFKAARALSDSYQRAVEGHNPWAHEALPQSIWIADVRQDANLTQFSQLFEAEQIGALGFIPLMQQGKLLGKFMIYAPQPRHLTPHELQLAETVASEVAQAVARQHLVDAHTRSWQQAEALARHAQRLHSITAELSQASSLAEVCQVVVKHGMAAVNAVTGGLWLIDPSGERAELVEALGYSSAGAEAFRVLRLNSRAAVPVLDAIRARRPLWIESRSAFDAHYPSVMHATALQPEFAVACLPMVNDGVCIGAVAFTFNSTQVFATDKQHFLTTLVHQCAQAIERSRLFERERQARSQAEAAFRRSAFLLDASTLLSSTLDYRDTLGRLAKLSVPRICDWCLIDVAATNDRAGEVFAAHTDRSKVDSVLDLRRLHPLTVPSTVGPAHVLRTGKAELHARIDDALIATVAQDEFHLRTLRATGMRSCVVVPIVARNRTFGTISFVSAESGRHFDAADLELAELLGRRAGIAVDNALLYEAAQLATRAREDVLAVVSHDLRTPLGVVVMGAQGLLSEQQPWEQTHRIADMIRRAADRMSRMIHDLLDFSSIASGRLTIESLPCRATEIVAATIEMFALQARERSIELTHHVDGDLPVFDCDRDRIVQALCNLVSNAVKATPANGRVQVGVTREDDHIVFFVEDTGPGIDPEHLEHVFDRYWRSAHANYRGTGLGLGIAKGIVDAHGGRIEAESTLGIGSRFRIRLPLDGMELGATRRMPDADTLAS